MTIVPTLMECASSPRDAPGEPAAALEPLFEIEVQSQARHSNAVRGRVPGGCDRVLQLRRRDEPQGRVAEPEHEDTAGGRFDVHARREMEMPSQMMPPGSGQDVVDCEVAIA